MDRNMYHNEAEKVRHKEIESLGWRFFGCPLKEDNTNDYPIVFRIGYADIVPEGRMRKNYNPLYCLSVEKDGYFTITKKKAILFNGRINSVNELQRIMDLIKIP